MSGAAVALTRLREQGVIGSWGLGVNRVEPCVLALDRADPDGFLLAAATPCSTTPTRSPR